MWFLYGLKGVFTLKRVLLALGEERFSGLIRGKLNPYFEVLADEVMSRAYLEPIAEMFNPEIIIVHDTFLNSTEAKAEARNREMLQLIQNLRFKLDDLRIVYICVREDQDPFLKQLIGLGIYDIFNTNSFSVQEFIDQIQAPAKYGNVKHFIREEVQVDDYVVVDLEKDSTIQEEEIPKKKWGFLNGGLLKGKVKKAKLPKASDFVTKLDVEELELPNYNKPKKVEEPSPPIAEEIQSSNTPPPSKEVVEEEEKVAEVVKTSNEVSLSNGEEVQYVTPPVEKEPIAEVVEELNPIVEEKIVPPVEPKPTTPVIEVVEKVDPVPPKQEETSVSDIPVVNLDDLMQPMNTNYTAADKSPIPPIMPKEEMNRPNEPVVAPKKSTKESFIDPIVSPGPNSATNEKEEEKEPIAENEVSIKPPQTNQESHKPKRRSVTKPIIFEKEQPIEVLSSRGRSCSVYAVASLMKGAGVTTIATQMAEALCQKYNRVAVVELNQSLAFEYFHAFQEKQQPFTLKEPSFEVNGVTYIKYKVGLGLKDLLNEYDAVVLDIGNLSSNHPYLAYFQRADYRYVLTPVFEWHWYMVDMLLEYDEEALDTYQFIFYNGHESKVNLFKQYYGEQIKTSVVTLGAELLPNNRSSLNHLLKVGGVHTKAKSEGKRGWNLFN